MNYICTWLALVLLLVTGCNSQDESTKIKIGAILDMSGPAASFGRMQKMGLDMALDEIGRSECPNIEFVIEDSRLDAKLAISAAKKLIEHDEVIAVTSITGSSMALSVAPIFNRSKVLVLDSLSSSPDLTEAGGEFYFRVQPTDSFAGVELVTWLKEQGFSKVAVVYSDSDWGQGLLKAVTNEVQSLGMTTTVVDRVRQGDVDFQSLLLRVKVNLPDALIVVAHPQEAGLLIKQASEIIPGLPIFGSDSLSTDEVRVAAGNSIDGTYFILSSAGSGDKYQNFQQGFEEKFGEQASANSIRPYDALMLLHDRICSGADTAEALKNSIQSGSVFEGVIGPITFDENGDISNPAYDRFKYEGTSFSRI